MNAGGTEGYMLREVHSRNVDDILVMYEARMEFLFVQTFELEPVQYHVYCIFISLTYFVVEFKAMKGLHIFSFCEDGRLSSLLQLSEFFFFNYRRSTQMPVKQFPSVNSRIVQT